MGTLSDKILGYTEEKVSAEVLAELVKNAYVTGADQKLLKKVKATIKGNNFLLCWYSSSWRTKTLETSNEDFKLEISHNKIFRIGIYKIDLYDRTSKMHYTSADYDFKKFSSLIMPMIEKELEKYN